MVNISIGVGTDISVLYASKMNSSALKYKLIIILIFICIKSWSQTDKDIYSRAELIYDSISLWSYDFWDVEPKDSLIICKIMFFRNKPVNDSLYQRVYGGKKTPSIIYSVYPVSMLDSIRTMSKHVQMFTSCAPPSIGGDYYVLNDFILINYSSCVNCASADYKSDLCRGNVKTILKSVSTNKYDTFEDLCNALPIDKRVKPNYHKLPRQIMKIAKGLTKENMILGRATGYSGEERAPYKLFKKLINKATIADLIKLTENKSPIIKGYAYWGLLIKDRNYILANRIKYSHDSEWIETNLRGCVPTPYKIKDFVEMLILIPEEHMSIYYEK